MARMRAVDAAAHILRKEGIDTAFARARALMKEHSVPEVVECILERITNIAMGTEINAVREWEPALDLAA